MKIDKPLISKMEKLSRLELSDQERENIQKDLGNILSMIEKLNDLDTTDVEPLVYISEVENVLRKDEVKNQLSRTEALKNAPQQNGEYFLVPKVISRS